jgi:CubicO group peptidase (beta-lactamase class C family)
MRESSAGNTLRLVGYVAVFAVTGTPVVSVWGQQPEAMIDSAVARVITKGAFPGAVVMIGTAREILYSQGFGHYTWDSESTVPSPDSTIFDLASLTKVVATTPSIMRALEMGLLSLDDTVQRILPGFVGDGKESVTVQDLLRHQSGLRAFLPLNDLAESAEEARNLVLTEQLRWAPGSRVEYSDLNAMLMGWVVESVSGLGLADFASRYVFAPAGMSDTRFGTSRGDRSRLMPVGLWRGNVIAGRIHDQNAAVLGGVSGHAGLYSTGADLSRYAQTWLNMGMSSEGRVFGRLTAAAFVERQLGGNRGLGWEMRNPESTGHTGTLLSQSAYGHGGYTGTSIWVDPELDLWVLVLTNRVFSPRTRRSITELRILRGVIADAAVLMKFGNCEAVEVVILGEGGVCG